MTNTLTAQDALADLAEVRGEISRINAARGEVVFNPAATACLDEVIEWLREENQ